MIVTVGYNNLVVSLGQTVRIGKLPISIVLCWIKALKNSIILHKNEMISNDCRIIFKILVSRS